MKGTRNAVGNDTCQTAGHRYRCRPYSAVLRAELRRLCAAEGMTDHTNPGEVEFRLKRGSESRAAAGDRCARPMPLMSGVHDRRRAVFVVISARAEFRISRGRNSSPTTDIAVAGEVFGER